MQSQAPGPYGPPYGSHGPHPPYSGAPQPPKKKGVATWVIVLVCIFGGLFFLGGPMAVIALYGVRKYIGNAKVAEARVSLRQVGVLAKAAYERDHRLCKSATAAVPESASSIRGTKYQSASGDWTRDASQNAGFACLGFSLTMPQYFQYTYASTSDRFVAEAQGDLNGDGTRSTFRIEGRVVGGDLIVPPTVMEIDPLE